jgi:anaerobic magnesium-protoporphyrin IX monomethyl ester cyclase
MARAGYVFFHMGIESLVPEMGKTLRGKGIFPDKLMQVLGWFKEFGIGVWGAVMIGAQGSSRETDLATLEGMKDLKRRGLISKIQYSIATPQPGTPFYAQARREGWLVTADYSQYNWLQSVLSYPHYSARQINAMRERYAAELG